MTSWRRVLCFGALWLAVSAGVLFAPACYNRNCDPSNESFGADAGEGVMLTPDMWVSGPIEGPWLYFPRQRIYFFNVPALGGRTPQNYNAFVSANPQPGKAGADFTQGAGNIVLFSGFGPNAINVKNDTCSDYYLHLVLEANPLPPAVINTTDPDAGIIDAATADADAEAGP